MTTLILSYTMQLVIPNVSTKFQYLKCTTSWEICDEIFIDEKGKWTNKRNDKHEDVSLSYMMQVVVIALIDYGYHRADKSVMKNFIGEKEKWINKEKDKYEDAVAVALLHRKASHTQRLYEISKS